MPVSSYLVDFVFRQALYGRRCPAVMSRMSRYMSRFGRDSRRDNGAQMVATELPVNVPAARVPIGLYANARNVASVSAWNPCIVAWCSRSSAATVEAGALPTRTHTVLGGCPYIRLIWRKSESLETMTSPCPPPWASWTLLYPRAGRSR